MPNKTARDAIRIHALADAKTYYVHKLEIYTGKQPDGWFQVNSSPLAEGTRLISEISRSGRNITFDN